jgi:outer membrane protein W
MKKITSVLCLVLFVAVAANAQEFKKFRVGVGAGYAMPSGEGAGGGVMWALEPGYRVNDQILANLRIEGAAIIRGTADATSASFDIAGVRSYTVNGQYYFNNNNFRPFVGVGFGIFSLAAAKFESNSGGTSGSSATAESKFGFYPRLGFDAKHFTVNLDYNFIPNTEAVISTGNGTVNTEFKNSYIGIRVGGYFGGGRK